MDPEKTIRKKKFLEKNNVEDMKELLGEEYLDMEAEFNKLDSENNEKVKNSVFLLIFDNFPGYVLWYHRLGVQEIHYQKHGGKKIDWQTHDMMEPHMKIK